MNVSFNSIEAKDIDKFICFDGNEDIDHRSSRVTINEMLVNPSGVNCCFWSL